MTYKVSATVANVSLTSMESEIEHEGDVGTLTVKRTMVEAIPNDSSDRTLTVMLPPEAVDEIEVGSKLEVTIEVSAPAAPVGEE